MIAIQIMVPRSEKELIQPISPAVRKKKGEIETGILPGIRNIIAPLLSSLHRPFQQEYPQQTHLPLSALPFFLERFLDLQTQ